MSHQLNCLDMKHAFIIVCAVMASFAVAGATCLADELGADPPRTPAEVFGQGVRETDKRSPSEELSGFHLPKGFVAELVAAEPQIAKPLNMAFDSSGRLWITDTTEYPYPAPAGTPAHDSIKVLSDTDHDGSFETVTTFAEGLNIPIGILPVSDGVLCFSIPNIMHLKDNDGDGRCDERKVVLGPFDTTRDTHGMINSLRRGDDGWIYACHGFNNQSHVKATDGSEMHLISGNTFRCGADGSQLEHFTVGQVNPFGMTNDEWGNWFTADCHSKPVTLLVRGGHYESFGRPHDGLGFVPSVMDHLHGSTAICGIVFYNAPEFPATFRKKFYSGNVMTSRINSNRLLVDRDHIRLIEEPDFMTSDDPWFRPVDVQLGPDGALYIADFYNKIIGHYEVRLDHPERDRTSGRIWRVSYRGDEQSPAKAPALAARNSSELLSAEHVQELGHENATRRRFALERFSGSQLDARQYEQLRQLAMKDGEQADALRVSAIWALHRLKLDTEQQLAAVLTNHPSPQVLVAALKAWEDRERTKPEAPQSAEASQSLRQAAVAALQSDIPQVVLAAAGALGQHAGPSETKTLLEEIARRPSNGSITQHAMRIAVKRLLQNDDLAEKLLAPWRLKQPSSAGNSAVKMNDQAAHVLADILPAVNTPLAAAALLSYTTTNSTAVAAAHREAAVKLACKHMRPEFADPLVNLLEDLGSGNQSTTAELFSDAPDMQTELATEAINTLRAGRHAIPQSLVKLLESKFDRLSAAIERELASSATKPVVWHATDNQLWRAQDRPRRGEGPTMRKFLSSHTLGEAYVGTMSSSEFACPNELLFWIVGHDGPPNMPAGGNNLVRLVDATTGAVLKTAKPPRNDTARQVRWDLRQWMGQPVRIECIDQDAGNAYAWIGVGGFSLPELNSSAVDSGVTKLAKLIELKVFDEDRLSSHISNLLDAPGLSEPARARLSASYAQARGLTLSKILIETAELRGQTRAVKGDIISSNNEQVFRACKELATFLALHMTLAQQTQLARGLIASAEGRQLLAELVDEGRMAPDSLRGLKDLLQSSAGEATSQRLAGLSEAAAASPSAAETAVVQRVSQFKIKSADSAKGKLLFEKNCANCHKLRGAGQLVGPQLDGVGARGVERLAEDVLLPNRNVDKAFRMSSLLLNDDRVIVGLVRETAGGEHQVIGSDGKQQSIDPSSIAIRKDTTRSLMPDNFAELLNDQELADLLQFIMQP